MNYTYRKKPVAIEAFRMTAERSMDNSEWPTWLHDAWQQDEHLGGLWIDRDAKERRFLIGTLEGTLGLAWGDWIIRGVKGEIYPCRNDIFEMTYDAVESKKAKDFRALYYELLYEVVCKFPGESRHETARRYIHEREHRPSELVSKEEMAGE